MPENGDQCPAAATPTGIFPATPAAAARGRGGAEGLARGRRGAPVRPGAAAREREPERKRARRASPTGERRRGRSGFLGGWREEAGRVPDLCLAVPEAAGGGRSAAGGGGGFLG